MRRQLHICQSVSGALKNWTKKDWDMMAKDNNCTPKEAKQWFQEQHDLGRAVIPIGEKCEGFDYVTGCPGHEVDANEP